MNIKKNTKKILLLSLLLNTSCLANTATITPSINITPIDITTTITRDIDFGLLKFPTQDVSCTIDDGGNISPEHLCIQQSSATSGTITITGEPSTTLQISGLPTSNKGVTFTPLFGDSTSQNAIYNPTTDSGGNASSYITGVLDINVNDVVEGEPINMVTTFSVTYF